MLQQHCADLQPPRQCSQRFGNMAWYISAGKQLESCMGPG
jgi:hypothetical protein